MATQIGVHEKGFTVLHEARCPMMEYVFSHCFLQHRHPVVPTASPT